MKSIAAGFRRQRMEQKPAGLRVSGEHQLQHTLEILARLLVGPSFEARRQRSEVKSTVRSDMTAVAAGVAGPLFQENGLNGGFENLKIERVFCGSAGFRSTRWWDRGGMTHPLGEHLPFRILPGLPKFAASMRRITTGGWGERMQEQAAAERIAGRHQLLDEREILSRLIFRPRRTAWRECLEAQARGQSGVAIVTTRTAIALLQKYGFDATTVGLEIERRIVVGGGFLWGVGALEVRWRWRARSQ